MDTLAGSVERITYYNPENGYSVLRLRIEGGKFPGIDREGLATIVGNLPEISAGEFLRLNGAWINHPKHGLQFQVETCEQALPATTEGIRRYLGSGLVHGVGKRLAERIVGQFGVRTLEVIENKPEQLLQVPDIGQKRVEMITRAWEEQKQVKEIMLFLHSYGISTSLAVKIYKQYNEQALNIVRTDPYRLARDIYGVGFKTADRIAQALGLPADHPSRIEAGIIFSLNEMTDDGHVFTPLPELVEKATELLGTDEALLSPAIYRLAEDGRVKQEVLPSTTPFTPPSFSQNWEKEGGRGEDEGNSKSIKEPTPPYGSPVIYLASLYHCETGLGNKIRQLAMAMPTRLSDMPPSFITLDPSLSEEQRGAIRTTLSQPVSILTGGPGTGKTTCLKALIAALELGHKRVALASPTGRAARRLSEATERSASTIHRMLGFKPGQGFKHNDENPLNVDFLVVDEASMLDVQLAYHLAQAIRPGTHLLLVGDVDQLPAVGAGDVLRDMIASGIAPVTRLNVIFRQSAGSHIITNAHRINQGQLPIFLEDSRDFFLFPAEKPEDAAQWVQEVVCERIPKKFGLDPLRQVQALAPMYRGAAGVDALNKRLQDTLNPASPRKPEKALFGQVFRLGDKVMQIQNNYDKDVYNGDIGFLVDMDTVEQKIWAEFYGRKVEYEWSETDQLTLAYAVSVHKSQGSEFPAIVLPIITAHYMMLQRNLLYTAITRAKQLCVLIGNKRAIAIAVHNDKVMHRNTALDMRLRER
ncbi:MAG: ATP-dependent RecD-like DNA helicase [Anaerolineales bacterium]|nr:ATP-dependent RecD-like DNA helicase [Anaerolineales bacterium]